MVEVLVVFLSLTGVSVPNPVGFKATAENGVEHGIRAWSALFGLLFKTSVCWGKGRWLEPVLNMPFLEVPVHKMPESLIHVFDS